MGRDVLAQMMAYQGDTNHGRGWWVLARWRPLDGDPPEGALTRTHLPELGPARREGLSLSCLSGVLGIEVIGEGEQVAACRYRRSENLWHDVRTDIVEAERAATMLDMAAHLLGGRRGPLSETDRIVVLSAVWLEGNTAHDGAHIPCEVLLEDGLLERSGGRYRLTARGRELLLPAS